LPIPVLLLLMVGCSTDTTVEPPMGDIPVIELNESFDVNDSVVNESMVNMTVENITNSTPVNISGVVMNESNTSTQYTVASETA